MKSLYKRIILALAVIAFAGSLIAYALLSAHGLQAPGGKAAEAVSISFQGIGGSGQQTGMRITPAYFGLTLNSAPNVKYPILNSFEVLGKINGANWKNENPSKGSYDWGLLNSTLANARKNGIDINEYTFFMPPSWVKNGCPGPPTKCAGSINISDWRMFVSNVVITHKGKIQYYELWNEPDNGDTFWSQSGDATANLVVLAANAYPIIKSLDPSAIVLAPGMSRNEGIYGKTWLKKYLKDGGSKYADAYAFHAYSCKVDCIHTGTNSIGCTAVLNCAGIPLIHEIAEIRSQMADAGVGNKPLYVTEGGVGEGGNGEDMPYLTDPNQRAAFVSRWYIILASYNVTSAVWYDWNQGQWGLATWPSAIVAYNQTYSWLNGATLTGACSLHFSNKLWECPMTRPGGYNGTVVWSNSTSQNYSYAAPQQYNDYRDLNGKMHNIDGAVSVSFMPMIVETFNPTNQTSTTSTTTTTVTSASTTSQSSTSTSSTSVNSTTSASTSASSSRTTTIKQPGSTSTVTSTIVQGGNAGTEEVVGGAAIVALITGAAYFIARNRKKSG